MPDRAVTIQEQGPMNPRANTPEEDREAQRKRLQYDIDAARRQSRLEPTDPSWRGPAPEVK